MIRYKQKVIADVHECVKDLEHLKIEEDKQYRDIEYLDQNIRRVAVDRAEMQGKIHVLENRVQDG